MGDVRRLPEPMSMDRGRLILPSEVVDKVAAWRNAIPPWEQREVENEYTIVTHPMVIEDCWLIGMTAFTAEPESQTLRCYGLRMTPDPSLRYDEVRMRREETL